MADILEKATESVPKEEVTSNNPHLKNLYDGLVMTEVQIQKVFTKHGLVKLNPDGLKFDPYEHEALFHAPMEGKEPGSVAVVTKVGYKLHGRTLRPALVGVAKWWLQQRAEAYLSGQLTTSGAGGWSRYPLFLFPQANAVPEVPPWGASKRGGGNPTELICGLFAPVFNRNII